MAAKIETGIDISKKDLQILALPFGLLIALLVLAFVSYKILYPRIQKERSDLALSKKDEQILTQKQQVLSAFSSQASTYVGPAVVAVPQQNSALMMVSQIKNLAATRLLSLGNLKIGTLIPDKSGLSKVQLQFDLDGDLLQSTAFLRDLEGVAPIANIEKIKVSQVSDISRVTVGLNVYSAPYPTKLPALTEPLTDLTQNEKETLAKIQNLVQPVFSQISPTAPQTRPNPFE